MKLKIAICVALAVVLQSSLTSIWQAFNFIDLPLIVVVYFALGRDGVLAVIVGLVAGLSTDALSGGILGANGFTKSLIGFSVATLATRVNLDNSLTRIFVVAAATAFDAAVYVLLHRMLGQSLLPPFVETTAFKLIVTTTIGTFIFYFFDIFLSERASTRRQFAFRRRAARRSIGRRGY